MSRFVLYNNNPDLLVENDCVCRAISLATDIDYKTVEEKLYLTSKLFDCEKLNVCCYKKYITCVLNLNYFNEAKNLSIGMFADLYPNGIFLVRVEGHLSVVYNGTIMDLFDCRDLIITDCWKVK